MKKGKWQNMKTKTIIASAIAAVLSLGASAASSSSATLNSIPGSAQVVTNVTFTGLVTSNDVCNIVTNRIGGWHWEYYDENVYGYEPMGEPTYAEEAIHPNIPGWIIMFEDPHDSGNTFWLFDTNATENAVLLHFVEVEGYSGGPGDANATATNVYVQTVNALGLAMLTEVNVAAQDGTNYTDTLKADIENGTITAYKSSNLQGTNSQMSADAIFDKINSSSGLSTNDVCNIVTNETDFWTFITGYSPTSGFSMEFFEDAQSNGVWFLYDNGTNIGTVVGIADDTIVDFGNDWQYGGLYTLKAVREKKNALGLARLVDLPPLTNGLATASITNGFITDAYISTNNAAFVNAVTNCPVAIAASDAEALAEWGIYGGGTVGALLAALAAAVAALKKKKMPLYPVGGSGNPVNATIESGVLTVSPFAMAAYAPTASAAFSVAMGALPSDMEAGKARDAVLVIDCSELSDGDEPTVTWGTNYHPRTDAGTDFACVAGAKNVYYISEYAQGEFAVGGWTETEGGNT